MDHCNNFWGSHGCDLTPSHDDEHRCIEGHEDIDPGYVTPADQPYLEVFSLKDNDG